MTLEDTKLNELSNQSLINYLNFVYVTFGQFIRLNILHLVSSSFLTFYIWSVHSSGHFTFGQFIRLDIFHLVSSFVWTFYIWSVHSFGPFYIWSVHSI